MIKLSEVTESVKSYFLKSRDIRGVVCSILCAYGFYKVIYYAFFDRLRDVPGHWFARFSFYPIRKAMFSGEFTRHLLSLHKKYGPVVRIGPNWVSDSSASDFKKVTASYKFRKSSIYDGFANVHESIFSTRNEEFNRMRRRQVGPAFSNLGLNSVEDIIENICIHTLTNKLNEIIDSGNGSAQFNYFKYFQNVTADVIGELAFGKSFQAIENDGHQITDWVNTSMKNFAISIIPGLTTEEFKLKKYCLDAINKRKDLIKNGKFSNDRIDILQMYLITENSTNKNPLSNDELIAEMVTMVIAGVDTTSITMTWLVTYYMLYPEIHNRVVAEIRINFPDINKKITYKEAREKLPYFVATVYETLRVRGSVGAALSREVPIEGINLSGYEIPKGTEIFMFIAGAHEDNQIWGNKLSFDPERFMGPEGEKFKKEILAFSSGIRICPGRNLAWMEIFMIIPNMLKNFDLSLTPNSLYGPNVLDPNNGNEPRVPRDISFATRPPENPERDCNLIITRHTQ
ncbi:Versicolorin B desaturase [Smittium mucronatum]|uniref:Versicolorin B desaturase n=1 Tax=Smittium mucronatum TaxID=133383 RepID=A0A1R0GRR5_9FUNG|nr:Versicolorin B desaturase [Smittium mucronatum]